jgi:hypothetical protein
MKEGAPVQRRMRLSCGQSSIRARGTQGYSNLGRSI